MSEQFTITLRPLPSDIPATVRLRRALKTLLRSYELRCLDVQSSPIGCICDHGEHSTANEQAQSHTDSRQSHTDSRLNGENAPACELGEMAGKPQTEPGPVPSSDGATEPFTYAPACSGRIESRV